MGYLQNVVITFVDNNVSRQIFSTFEMLHKFTTKFGPEIEEVYAEYNTFVNQPFINIGRREIESYLREDLKAAQQALQWYTVVMNSVGNNLALFTSNFGLFAFLEENGISKIYLPDVNQEIKSYWSQTYEPIFERLKLISVHLQELHRLLKEQIAILETIPQTNYLTGFELEPKLKILFEQERTTFWILVKSIEESKNENSAFALLSTYSKKVKRLIQAHLTILKKGFQKEIKESETIVQKSLVLLSYLIGAALLYSNIQTLLAKKGIKAGLSRIQISHEHNQLTKLTGVLQSDNMTDFTAARLEKLLRLL